MLELINDNGEVEVLLNFIAGTSFWRSPFIWLVVTEEIADRQIGDWKSVWTSLVLWFFIQVRASEVRRLVTALML